AAIASEPLADVLAVAALATAAPPEPQRQQRQREPPYQRVQKARHQAARRRKSLAASSTWSGVGDAPSSPTSRACAPAHATPCRSRSVARKIATVRVPS